MRSDKLRLITMDVTEDEGLRHTDISSSNTFLYPIDLQSANFRDQYSQIITTNLSPKCVKRESVAVARCLAIRNLVLEQRFANFEKDLKAQKAPANVTYAFMLLLSERECQLFAQFGVPVNNVLVGDLGDPCNGVYLHDHPDLVTPAPFLGQTKISVLVCKILKGRTNYISLGSYRATPTADCNSHKCPTPAGRKLTRHESFRYSQIFLFERRGEGYSEVPSNILPFAFFELIFPHNSIPSFKPMSFTVWNGTLKVGNISFSKVRLSSTLPTLKPPFLGSIYEVKDFVSWTNCMSFAPLLELLTVPYLGEVPLRHEVVLKDTKRCVSYFQLQPTQPDKLFNCYHESMRLRRVAGITVFPTVGLVIMIPNSWFSSLLALPIASCSTYHCLYVTANEHCSLLSGMFDKFTAEDDAEFDRNPVLQEHIDGVSSRVQELVRKTADQIIAEQKEELKIISARASKNPGDAPLLANQVVLIDSDDEDFVIVSSGSVTPGTYQPTTATNSHVLPITHGSRTENSSVRNVTPTQTVMKREIMDGSLSSTKPTDKQGVSPSVQVHRKRPTDPRALPLPKITSIKSEFSAPGNSNERINATSEQTSRTCDKEQSSRCYSPSDAVSSTSGESSPTSLSHAGLILESRTDEAVKSNVGTNSQLTLPTNASPSQRSKSVLESAAGCLQNAQVYIASAKPVTEADPRANIYAPHHFPAREYKPIEIAPFAKISLKTSSSGADITKVGEVTSMFREYLGSTESESNSGKKGACEQKQADDVVVVEDMVIDPDEVNSGSDSKHLCSVVDRPRQGTWPLIPIAGTSFYGGTNVGASTGDVDLRKLNTPPVVARHEAVGVPKIRTPSSDLSVILTASKDTDYRVRSFPPASTSAGPMGSPSITPPFVTDTNSRPLAESPTFGFFNPIRPPLPHEQSVIQQISKIPQPQVRSGAVILDESFLTSGAMEPNDLRDLLHCFGEWRKNHQAYWSLKLHANTREALKQNERAVGESTLLKRYAQYEAIIGMFEAQKVMHVLTAHQCDTYRGADVLSMQKKCLEYISKANKSDALIYLTNDDKYSERGKQVIDCGLSLLSMTELRKMLGL